MRDGEKQRLLARARRLREAAQAWFIEARYRASRAEPQAALRCQVMRRRHLATAERLEREAGVVPVERP